MDLFLVQVDGLDVSFTSSREAAFDHARRLALEDPTMQIRVVRVRDGMVEVLSDGAVEVFSQPPAEAATALG